MSFAFLANVRPSLSSFLPSGSYAFNNLSEFGGERTLDISEISETTLVCDSKPCDGKKCTLASHCAMKIRSSRQNADLKTCLVLQTARILILENATDEKLV